MNDLKYKDLPETEKRKQQKTFHENEMNYFSSFAFEVDAISKDDISELNNRIDKKVSGNSFGFNLNTLTALAIGVFIGCSALFVYYEDIQTHDAHAENNPLIPPTEKTIPPAETEKTNAETVATAQKEHFHSSESAEQLNLSSPMENADIKDINAIDVKPQTETAQEDILNYIPNSSVIYIYDLKVANYKGYYFKNSSGIDVRDNGLSAQFANKEEANSLNKKLEDRDYYAHEIIKDAMEFFNKKQYAASIELLELLKGYNKDDVNAQFYLGMSYYYTGNYTKSSFYLENTKNNGLNIFLQEAEFYSALCLQKSGKTNEAAELFKKIAAKKLFYAERATQELN